MEYKFRFRRRFRLFFRSFTVIGHRYDDNLDKMVLYIPDGGVREISRWKYCDAKLGTDWALAMKKDMEAKAGQAIPTKVV